MAMVLIGRTDRVSRFREVIAGEEFGVDVVTGERYRLDASSAAPARQALVLELD
jgi:hypothetical protein